MKELKEFKDITRGQLRKHLAEIERKREKNAELYDAFYNVYLNLNNIFKEYEENKMSRIIKLLSEYEEFVEHIEQKTSIFTIEHRPKPNTNEQHIIEQVHRKCSEFLSKYRNPDGTIWEEEEEEEEEEEKEEEPIVTEIKSGVRPEHKLAIHEKENSAEEMERTCIKRIEHLQLERSEIQEKFKKGEIQTAQEHEEVMSRDGALMAAIRRERIVLESIRKNKKKEENFEADKAESMLFNPYFVHLNDRLSYMPNC